MQAYPSMSNGHGQSYALANPAAAASSFYAAQSSPSAYSAMLPSAYVTGRSLKQSGQSTAGYLTSPYGAPFPVQSVQTPYASAYPGGPYNGAFSSSPSCSSPGFTAQQALDYSSYANYAQNPAYAYYSQGYAPAFMSAAQAAQAQAQNPTNLTTTSGAGSASYQLPQNPTSTDSHYSSNSTATTTPSPPLKENGSNGSTGKKGRTKARGRKQNNPSPPPESDNMERVFIWDLDETIIFLHTMLHPDAYPAFHTKMIDPHSTREAGESMETLITQVAMDNFFHYDLEDCDQVHIDDVASDDNNQDLSGYNFAADGFRAISPNGNLCMASGVRGGVDWMRKLAFRYRRIKEIYNMYKGNAGALCGFKRDELHQLREQLDESCNHWSSIAIKCLGIISRRTKSTNVLVTNNQLVAGISKVLLFGLGPLFPVDNIYSSTKVGRESCFERIAHRFGKSCTFVVVGNKLDVEMAAKEHKFPYWRVNTLSQLLNLQVALENDHL
ncbi:Eyes absent-like protein 1 [Hypsibius exemplaris]|uniref:Eyes absent homolog n=1 Tax=Hypsibius exemplaris TaxID=2072580 RepID=A0A9X6RK10_HYPEX|nr:Eyes absent-like protein 1 [Hypsibius exemplaris]